MYTKTQRRRRVTVVCAAVSTAAILAVPTGASAAKFSGVVVDKDVARGTVATATKSGDVRTVRLPARAVKKARAGQRVTVNAPRLADGTYNAKAVRTRGTSRRAKVRGAVIEKRGRQLLISAGGTVLGVRAPSSLRARAAAARTVGAGDIVVADVTLSGQGIQASDVRDVGNASVVELEGIVLGLSDGVLRLAVARRGEVEVVVPDGTLPSPPSAGDQVEAVVSLGDTGTLTLVALKNDDDDDDNDDHGFEVDAEDGEMEADGILTEISADSISIGIRSNTVTCAVPAGTDLSGFTVGDKVEAKCQVVDGGFVLQSLESDEAEYEAEDAGEDEGDDDRGSDRPRHGSDAKWDD